MHDVISFLEANSTLVLANPAVFASFAVLFGGGGFVVGRYLLTERLANLESRIARRDEEITELKAKKKVQDPEPPMVPIIGTVAIGPTNRSELDKLDAEAAGRLPMEVNERVKGQPSGLSGNAREPLGEWIDTALTRWLRRSSPSRLSSTSRQSSRQHLRPSVGERSSRDFGRFSKTHPARLATASLPWAYCMPA
ncbi:hypothetical protein NKJ73_30510 [Mesorhizobium sp. M0074]|uniref:hypothetical protein n=1 Tax=Mesorhizobium sp. M0074 TaxID=2956869 RepID=UPI003337BB20